MARRVNMISEINDSISTLKLQVRVMSLWEVMKFENNAEVQSLEMLLIDEEGDKIQATANDSHINKYRSSIIEGNCYLIGNLTVSKNNGRYKVTRHNFRLFFQNTTAMKEVNSEKIPKSKFDWASFTDIGSGAINRDWIIDIIARVVNINNDKYVHRSGNPTRKIEVELEDERKSRMNCTLWGRYAEDICSELDKSVDNCLVIALHLAIIRDVKGNLELSNSMYGTKLYINPDWEEAKELKNRTYPVDGALSLKSTQLSASSKQTPEEDWLSLTNRKTIADLKTTREVGTWNVLGTVHKLVTNYGWSYSGCSKCTKKIDYENNIAKCKNCKGTVFAVPR
ncbi:replication protein A 70 kDa DNA-binding subunit A-like [Lotus japonicus]|uniref:replication protein A 70 kDa DNA-binding subunit A-like n=1 Tax=Lotus japonicus TaxID=34305 RepID=UPI002590056E|nr:replication protein A 70 kDa DNA-binding subunit A-like [Lotus japonicus]